MTVDFLFPDRKTPSARQKLVELALTNPAIKSDLEALDRSEGRPDNSGINRHNDCRICQETYTGRGRKYGLGICDNCLDIYTQNRDKDLVRLEEENEICLTSYVTRRGLLG